MPCLSRICAIAILLLASGHAGSTNDKFAAAWSADAVVVGQLQLSSYFLWFDGLHVNGSIQATEILYGVGTRGSEFAYHLVAPCSLWVGCPYRAVWQHWSETKRIFTQGRIWALIKGAGSSWTSWPNWYGIYDLTDREDVIANLERRKKFFTEP